MKKYSVKSKANITFILGSLTAGGAEKVASFLIDSLQNAGCKVSLVSRRGSEADFFTIPDSINRIVLGGEGESGNKLVGLMKNVLYVARLRKALKRTNPDVVISFLTRPNIYTILATRFMNCRVVISERNDTTRQTHDWPWGRLRRKLYSYADVITANSQIALDGMAEYVPGEKMVLIPNPVEVPQGRAVFDQSKRILNVGRLEKVKNQRLIIDAFGKTKLHETGWSLDFLGEGSDVEPLEVYKNQTEFSDHITFHGLVKNIETWYQNAALFVLASDYEGTPNALLEAMASGLPSIVSDSLPGAVELIGTECGLVFRHGSVEDLSQKIALLSDSPELRKTMGEKARKRVEEFSPDRVFQLWSRILTG